MSTDNGFKRNSQTYDGWCDVTKNFQGCERGASILYKQLNGWTGVGVVLERCYTQDCCCPALWLRTYRGLDVLVAIRNDAKVEVDTSPSGAIRLRC